MNCTVDLYETPEWLDLHFQAKHEHRRNTVNNFDIRRGERILDVGCGTGSWTELFLNCIGCSGEIIGIDSSLANINCATQWLKDKSYKNVTFQNYSLEQIDTISGNFDAIILGNVSGYFDDRQDVFKYLLHRLSPGGRLIVRQHDEGALTIAPVRESLLCYIKYLIAKKQLTSHKRKQFDLFAGRGIRFDLKSTGFKQVTACLVPFEAEAPFQSSLSKYIELTCKWMLSTVEDELSDNLKEEWIETTIDKIRNKTRTLYFCELEYLYHAYC